MKYILLLITFILAISCDKGLEPPPEPLAPGYLKGTVYFENEWPPEDSLFGVRIAAFRSIPNEDILTEFSNGNVYFNFEPFPNYVDSAEFILEIKNTPDTLRYIVAAYQYKDSLSSQIAAGVYTETDNKSEPSTVIINPNDTVNIKIEVDWDDYPPQPF